MRYCAIDAFSHLPLVECVPGRSTPNLSKLRKWGCKAYVLIPKTDRRKDWEDKAMVRYFIAYSKSKTGYRVILKRSADCFRELDEGTAKVHPKE